MPAIKAPMSAVEVAKLGVGNHRVGGAAGLTLQIKNAASRSWTLRYTALDGRRREVGIGSAWEITLAQARAKALQLRVEMKLDSVDPIEARRDRVEQAVRAAAERAAADAEAAARRLQKASNKATAVALRRELEDAARPQRIANAAAQRERTMARFAEQAAASRAALDAKLLDALWLI